MGMQTAPAQLFYDFCLDDHVPEVTCFDASTGFLISKRCVRS